jgi:non-specific serine/threonine protein kinase
VAIEGVSSVLIDSVFETKMHDRPEQRSAVMYQLGKLSLHLSPLRLVDAKNGPQRISTNYLMMLAALIKAENHELTREELIRAGWGERALRSEKDFTNNLQAGMTYLRKLFGENWIVAGVKDEDDRIATYLYVGPCNRYENALERSNIQVEEITERVSQFACETSPSKSQAADQEPNPIGSVEAELPEIDESEIIGRAAAIERICNKLLTREGRLVSLIGEGGVGKTTLALIVRQRVRKNFEGGVWFVKLSGFSSPDHLALAKDIADKFGLHIASKQLKVGTPTPAETKKSPEEDALVNHFGKNERLLILDNCEHLGVVPSLLVETLLRRSPRLKVLATSRRPLGLLGLEDFIVVQPLEHSLPGGATMAEVLTLPAIQLFLRRAGLSDNDAKALGENFVAKVSELAMRLEGVPLCIVLAAAHYRLVQDIDAILNDLIRALSMQDPRLEPKEKAVKASIEWSVQLLSPMASDLLLRLSVFYGGWDNHALRTICATTTKDHPNILDAQAELERIFLILPAGGRHRMNSVVRDYAFERLESTGQADAILRDHAEHYARLAHNEGQKVVQRDIKPAMALLTSDSENFKRALDWCRTHNARLGLRLVTSLWQYWVVKGLFSFGRANLEEFLRACPDAPPSIVCRALAGSATLAYHQSDYRSVLDLARRFLSQARKVQDIWAEVVVLVIASVAEVYQPSLDRKPPGPRTRAMRYLDRSVKLADGQPSAYWLQALAHSNRAFLRAQLDAGKLRSGWRKLLAEASQAVLAARQSRNEWIIAVALTNEAFTIWGAHPNPDRASVERLLQIALKSRHDIGDRYGILQIFGLLAHLICTAKASGTEDYRRAAILLGIQDAMQDQKEIPIPALNDKAIKNAREVLRTKLPSDVDRLWSYAREKMSYTDALQFALGELTLDWRSILG